LIKSLIKGLLSLISFLTIIPTKEHDLRLAAKYFYLVPAVGLIRGLIVAVTTASIFSITKDPLLASVTSLAMHALIQGFNHIDGFIDFSEAILSGSRGYEALKIVKDVHRGAFAIAIYGIYLLIAASVIRYVLLIANQYLYVVLILTYSEVASASTMFILAKFSRLPNYDGLGKLFIVECRDLSKFLKFIAVLTACLTPASILVISLGSTHYVVLAVSVTLLTSVVSASVLSRYLANKVLGFTQGDVLGFTNEFSWINYLIIYSILITLIGRYGVINT